MEDGPGIEAVVDRVGGGRVDELDVVAGLAGLGVEEEVDVEGPSTTGVVEAGSVFFLVDLGVRSRRRASRFPIAAMASPTSRSEPLIVTAREPETTVGDTESFA